MAPGPFSGLLAPFIGARKSKKYEKLQTDDPEKKRQEATQEEINRLHNKIVSFFKKIESITISSVTLKKSLKLYVNVIWILAALDLFFFLFCCLEGYKCTLKYLLPMMATGSDYQKTIQRLGLLPKNSTFSYKYFIKICLGFTEY